MTHTYRSWGRGAFGEGLLLGGRGVRVAQVSEGVDVLPGPQVLRHPDGRPLPGLACQRSLEPRRSVALPHRLGICFSREKNEFSDSSA